MTKTTDIAPDHAARIPVITDLASLTCLVNDLATKQLLLNEAEARLQAQVEAAKLAFNQGTADILSEIQAGFLGIQKFCDKNKDTLFPTKAGKRVKTFAVLQHKLQYRESSTIDAPKDATARVRRAMLDLTAQLAMSPSLTAAQETGLKNSLSALETLLRQPPEELNKDAAKAAWEKHAGLLRSCGISLETGETFKLVFQFSPDQVAP